MRVGPGRKLAVAVAALALLSACSTGGQVADQTVTSFVTAGPASSAADSSEPAAASSSPAESPAASSPPATSAAASSSAAPVDPNGAPQDGVALADGYVPKKLQPGEKPPQFIIVSFDGVGWHEKWQHWFDVAKQVPFRFTG